MSAKPGGLHGAGKLAAYAKWMNLDVSTDRDGLPANLDLHSTLMRIVPVQDDASLEARSLPPDMDEAIQILNEHHLVMIEDGWNERHRLAGDFGARLDLLPQTKILHLDGTRIFDRRSARSAIEAVSQPEGDLNLLPLVRRIGIGFQRVYCIWNHAQLLFQR